MASEIKHKAVSGMAWTGIERFGTQIVQFLVEVIIARILMPSDYGIIAMLAIFMAIAQTFLDSGFASALIQKKGRTEVDYSTVFYFNIFVAVFIYLLFYLTAPIIATFYNMPILTDVTRLYSIALIFNGLTIVQTAKLSIDLDFKSQAYASITSVVISGAIGIFMAYVGYGVWALVAQGVILAAIRMVMLWILSSWMPLLTFSTKSFRQLFSFGSKLLASGMINTVFMNVYSLVIGKAFAASKLGLYNRAEKFSSLPSNTFTQIVIKVNYPILSQYQDDNKNLLLIYKRLLRTPMFILYPLLFGMITLAYPVIELMLGEKWLSCVSMFQILCIGCLWTPLTHINLNLLYVKGRSDVVLRLEFIKKPLYLLILLCSIPFGLLWICVGKSVCDFMGFAINCYYTNKLLGYGFVKQLMDIAQILINCIIMSLLILVVISLFVSPVEKMIVGVIIGSFSYFLLSWIEQDESFNELKNLLFAGVSKLNTNMFK